MMSFADPSNSKWGKPKVVISLKPSAFDGTVHIYIYIYIYTCIYIYNTMYITHIFCVRMCVRACADSETHRSAHIHVHIYTLVSYSDVYISAGPSRATSACRAVV